MCRNKPQIFSLPRKVKPSDSWLTFKSQNVLVSCFLNFGSSLQRNSAVGKSQQMLQEGLSLEVTCVLVIPSPLTCSVELL